MNPKMRLRSLKLVVRTDFGVAQRRLDFGEGLNVIRADNTSGKSTALQAIVYVLGLEGMLSPSRRVPLAHAMTDSIEIDGVMRQVVESFVALEIENARGDIITTMRSVVHSVRDKNLVTVASGPELTGERGNPRTDYFVRVQGSAQNASGFHRYLAEFLGLKLPRVTRIDGSEGLLYLETLFPYFYVEQKHGWASVQARVPSYLGIRDVGKRSAEYILGLDSLERIIQRQRIRSTLSELEADWHAAVSKLNEAARLSHVVVQNLPKRISQDVSHGGIVPQVVLHGEWKDLAEAVTVLRAERDRLAADPVPTVENSAREIESNLQQTEHSLRQALAVSASIAEERGEIERQNQQTQLRLEALQEDLQKHKDTQVLERLGAQHAHALLAERVCPTCHQQLEDGSDISTHAMTSTESIKFIEQQISTFKNVHNDYERVISAILAREQSLATEIHGYRSEIRAARDTLRAPNSSPSIADIAHRLRLENRIEELDRLSSTLEVSRNEVEQLHNRWVKQREFLDGLETESLSSADRQRIDRLQQSVRAQLNSYRFQSLNPSEIEIDTTTYRPVYEGFDLGFDLSASDMIRLIWAYLLGVLETGQEPGGQHLGLLIFDEPRQQDAAKESYAALLAHASKIGETGAQVIFATSEPGESLREMLADNPAHILLLAPGEKLLQKIS